MEASAKSSARDVTQRKSSYWPIAVSRNEYSSCVQPPQPRRLAPAGAAEHLVELAGDGDRVNQRPVQVEGQYLAVSHRPPPAAIGRRSPAKSSAHGPHAARWAATPG